MKKYIDIFRIKLGPDPPAKVDPYRVSLKQNHRPFRCTQRRYIGAVKHNPTARWASPALAVPKPGTDSFRFTVDLRGVNEQTIPVASAMPDLESMIRSVGEDKIFAKMDMVHAYWQIPTREIIFNLSHRRYSLRWLKKSSNGSMISLCIRRTRTNML